MRIGIGLLLAYLALPIDLIPDFIPLLGHADDAILTTLVLRSVVRHAGIDAVRRHWPGTPDGFTALCRLTGMLRLLPHLLRLLRRLAADKTLPRDLCAVLETSGIAPSSTVFVPWSPNEGRRVPGGQRDTVVPIMASNGELVVNAEATVPNEIDVEEPRAAGVGSGPWH